MGPRPVVLKEMNQIEERDKYSANEVRPGITGWAQINGRDTLDVVEKARYDGYYANHISFLFDLKILFKTVIVVLKRSGVDPN